MDSSVLRIGQALEEAAASEIVAYYQYSVVTGALRQQGHGDVADEFLRIAKDELDDHYLGLLGRMCELGYIPTRLFNIDSVSNGLSPCAYAAPVAVEDLAYTLQQNIEAEACAIEVYSSILALPELDQATRELVEGIKVDEEEHKADLTKLLL